MNAPRPPQCALGKLQYEQMDVEEVKADGFNLHGILVVKMDDRRVTPIERQVLKQLGNRLYGRAIRG